MLEIQDIFPTIQGEGPWVGTPAVFIRLGGCNLACSFCDTEFETFTAQPLPTILQTVHQLANNAQQMRVRHLIVITGGEPFRQPISPLCTALLNDHFEIQIETNGTLFRPIDPRVTIVCSPKNTGYGYTPLRADILEQCIALKFIVSPHHNHYATVSDVGQHHANIPVYVQPMDEHDTQKNAENLAFAQTLCNQYGYRLSIQLHKYLGIA